MHRDDVAREQEKETLPSSPVMTKEGPHRRRGGEHHVLLFLLPGEKKNGRGKELGLRIERPRKAQRGGEGDERARDVKSRKEKLVLVISARKKERGNSRR